MTLFKLAQVGAACVVFSRLAHGARRRPPIQPVLSSPTSPSASVVIPARNESARIGPCLDAITLDSAVKEVIVVDDESSDDTTAVATRAGVTVIKGTTPPAGWVGKPWALHQGLAHANGKWVVFIDADTVPRPGMVNSLIAASVDSNADLLSVGPRFVCNSGTHQALHASMLATLVYRFGPAGSRHIPSPERVMANGQCMIAERAWLLTQGGFALAAPNMTDDIALARALASRGGRVVFLDGSRVIDTHMHTTTAEVWREWGRSLPMSDVTDKTAAWFDLACIWLTMALPLVRVLARRSNRLDKLLVGVRVALCIPLRHSYRKPVAGVVLSPFADVASAVRLTQGTLRPVRTWRGRTY